MSAPPHTEAPVPGEVAETGARPPGSCWPVVHVMCAHLVHPRFEEVSRASATPVHGCTGFLPCGVHWLLQEGISKLETPLFIY
jgi:hypothetical protein